MAQPLAPLQSPLSQARGLQARVIIQAPPPLQGEEGGLSSLSLCLEAAQVVLLCVTHSSSPGCAGEQPPRHGGDLLLTLCPECGEQHFPITSA